MTVTNATLVPIRSQSATAVGSHLAQALGSDIDQHKNGLVA